MNHPELKLAGLALAGIALLAAPAAAQDKSNVLRGQRLAARICADCHGVRKGELSPNRAAPSFPRISTTDGMTAAALNVALTSSHRQMPNLIIDPKDRADVVAYILSLKDD